MAVDLSTLNNEPRLLLEAELKPVQGERFQATGFPDLGPARYQLHDGTEMLLVESAQSVANRLESVCWDEAKGQILQLLEGLPYIEVLKKNGTSLTNSILEAHRINSPYILENKDQSLFQVLKQDVAGMEEGAVDIRRMARTVFKYDTNAVLHGVFLAKSDLAGGRLRMPRALSGFIEARNVVAVESGGVKNDRVNPSGETRQGFGNVPFHRTEFTAEKITAFFNLDLSLLNGYGFDQNATELLVALAIYKAQLFLKQGLRLRTACDLECKNGLKAVRPNNFVIPAEDELGIFLQEKILACRRPGGSLENAKVFQLTWEPKEKAPAKSKEEANTEGGE